MNKKFYILAAMMIFLFGCGESGFQTSPDSSLSLAEESGFISEIAIAVENNLREINGPAQLFLAVTLSTGETIYGLTTEFTDPESGEAKSIEWSVSDTRISMIDDGARLLPLSQGYAEVRASLEGRSASKIIFVNRSADFSVSGDDGETPGGDGAPSSEVPSESPCQGHATGMVSFVPGTGGGFGSSALPGIVLGPPQGRGDFAGSTHVVSLGRGGEIILDLGRCFLTDGPGVDLIIFENAFLIGGDPSNPYAELGAVGLSEDGISFVEFACSYEHYPYTGCAGWHPVYSSVSNDISPFDVDLAGGDKFDLAEIGVESARYIRIRDMGSAGFGTSVGFDLDALSVINGIRTE